MICVFPGNPLLSLVREGFLFFVGALKHLQEHCVRKPARYSWRFSLENQLIIKYPLLVDVIIVDHPLYWRELPILIWLDHQLNQDMSFSFISSPISLGISRVVLEMFILYGTPLVTPTSLASTFCDALEPWAAILCLQGAQSQSLRSAMCGLPTAFRILQKLCR